MHKNVVAVAILRNNHMAELKLHPFDLGAHRRQSDRGTPEPASAAGAQRIPKRLQGMSGPYGTQIAIEDNVSVIQMDSQG